MKSAILLGSIFSLVSTLAIATPGLAGNSPSELLHQTPNNSFPVVAKSGKCPKNVKAWTHFRPYEGGAEWTVIANTLAIADSATLVSKTVASRRKGIFSKVAVFSAPLKPAFKSCRGVAVSTDEDLSPYKFEFQGGKVIFRVTLPKDTPSNPSGIVQARTIQGRPLVRWAIAD
jgi:hypothetical protein